MHVTMRPESPEVTKTMCTQAEARETWCPNPSSYEHSWPASSTSKTLLCPACRRARDKPKKDDDGTGAGGSGSTTQTTNAANSAQSISVGA